MEDNKKKVLEAIEEQRKQMLIKDGLMENRVNQDTVPFSHQLQQEILKAPGTYITVDSNYGNPIIPIVPQKN